MIRTRVSLSLLAFAGVTLSGVTASAQTISASAQPFPSRIAPDGTDLGVATRPADLNPQGVSYADCMSNLTLNFTVTVAGFTGDASIQVWATQGNGDCTAPTARGIGATTATCWRVNAGITNPVLTNPQTYTLNVRVQDLVGWQNTELSGPQAGSPPPLDAKACSAQATFAAVPMSIDFLPVDDSGTVVGTPYQYAILTDMVGPPAPQGVKLVAAGDDLVAGWTPNTDGDTRGYQVFFAPVGAASGAAGAPSCASSPLATLADGGSPQGAAWTPPSQYLVPPPYAGDPFTVADPRATGFDFGAQPPGTEGSFVVAGVDAFGNVGAPSALACGQAGTGESSAQADPASNQPGGRGGCTIASVGGSRGTRGGAAGLLAALATLGLASRRRAPR